jgi:hypothetical protein
MFRIATIAVRTRGDPLAFAPRLNQIMREIDADAPLYWVRDYAAVVREMTVSERVIAKSFGAFGLIALALAGAGLYGVMVFTVTRRTREIGVRRALGSPSRDVLRSVFGRSFLQLGLGLVVGVAVGIPLARLLTQTLQNIGATKNTGLELGLSTLNVRNWRGVSWSSEIQWSHNKNSIEALASGATSDVGNVWFLGHPINIPNDAQRRVFYDWKYVGVWQYADTVLMKQLNANGSTFKVGDPRVADVNGDGKINADDRTIVGNSYPAWSGSMSNRITYKGWDFSALVTAKWNYTFIDGTPRSYFGRFNNIADLDYWTPTNPTNKNPAPTTGGWP